jgi:hypothetical protein
VVAVADDEAAWQIWAAVFGAWPKHLMPQGGVAHHVPDGIAWRGPTAAGTNAGAPARFVRRRGEGIYALAVVVDDHPAPVAALDRRGVHLTGGPGFPQTFVHPATTHGILLDLVPERHSARIARPVASGSVIGSLQICCAP